MSPASGSPRRISAARLATLSERFPVAPTALVVRISWSTDRTDVDLHVPLIVRPRGGLGAPVARSQLASLMDVAPTLLEITGLSAPASMHGVSFEPLLRGRGLTLEVANDTRREGVNLGGHGHRPPPSGRPGARRHRRDGPLTYRRAGQM